MSAGYSGKSLKEKLGIKEGFRMLVVNPQGNYWKELGKLPSVRIIKNAAKDLDFIHFFTESKAELEKEFPRLRNMLKPSGMLWVSWLKGSSGIKTDLNENIVREIGLKAGLVDVKVAAIDENWSGLKFVFRLKDRK